VADTTEVTVRYFAGAKAAAGVPEERVSAASLADLTSRLAASHGAGLARVLQACSYLVDGTAARDRSARLPAGATVDVLPPFAGG
jgi:molybdopterin synthase sulfur carrier subunit